MKDGLTDRACSKWDKAARITPAITESTADANATWFRDSGLAAVRIKMAPCRAMKVMMAPYSCLDRNTMKLDMSGRPRTSLKR